jgi:hypothetical protein
MTTLAEYYTYQFSAERLFGIQFASTWLSLIALIWLLGLAYLILRANSKNSENRFMAILIACEAFKAGFLIKGITPRGPEWWHIDQYLWNFNTSFFISAHVCSIGLYLCFPIYYRVKQLSFLYNPTLQRHAWYAIPFLTAIFMVVTADLWLYENYAWIICNEVGAQPEIHQQMGTISQSMQETIDSIGTCPTTGVWDIEDTPVIGFILIGLSPLISIGAVIVMRASMKQYANEEIPDSKNSLTSRSLYLGFLGKVIGNMFLFSLMFLIIPALHGGSPPSLGDALVDGLDETPTLAQVLSDYSWMLVGYMMVLPFAFEGMMFAHATMKDTVLGIDSTLRRTFRNSIFAGFGAILFLIGSELMESIIGYGMFGGVLLGASVLIVRKPVISALDRFSNKIMPSAYTEAESTYLEAYSAAKDSGEITTSERKILHATANALKISPERANELEISFDSEESEQITINIHEPTVVKQWTDEKGHTWRVMDDETYRWWDGSDWQKV